MMIKRLKHVVGLVALSVGLVACAPPQTSTNVQLGARFWSKGATRVSVARGAKPRIGVYQQARDAKALRRLASTSLGNDFQEYLKRVRTSSYSEMQKMFIVGLRKHDVPARAYAKRLPLSRLPMINSGKRKVVTARDYRPLRATLEGDRLLLLNIDRLGAVRNKNNQAAGPNGQLAATVAITGQLVDLKTNRTLWRYTAVANQPVKGKWDQPPNYKNFTRALDQAIQMAEQQLSDSFFTNS